MPKEIERKFLLKNEDWRSLPKTAIPIKQGYLNSEKERTVRVRIKGEKGFLTVKGKTVNASRLEFEYEIPQSDALQLLKLCESPIIEKIRYEVPLNGNVWEIDEFDGINKGLIMAEVELESENQSFIKPNWIGEEVTSDIRYYNSNLISHPFSKWEK